MMIRQILIAAAAALLLAACGSGPVKRISPPTASIQELIAQPDGQWKLRVRIQNFSNVPMTFSAINATLRIAGNEAGKLNSTMDFDVSGGSADVIDLTLRTDAPVPAEGNIAYDLKGTIESSDPKGSYSLERSSHLSPVPGLQNTWR
jgi:uncharacterized lipoprotein YmbA